MAKEIVMDIIRKEFRQNNNLNQEKLEHIFMDCVLTEKDIIKDNPEHKVIEGVTGIKVFKQEKLLAHQEEIASMIDEIENIEEGQHFLLLGFTKDGIEWANSPKTIDALLSLGLATNILQILPEAERKDWKSVFETSYGLPYVKKRKEKTIILPKEHPLYYVKK